MSPRPNSVQRSLGGIVVVVLDGVEHRLSEAAFIAWMERAVDVLQILAASRKQG